MPIQIDRIDTTIEVTSSPGPLPSPPRPRAVDDPAARAPLRELVIGVFADELDRYLRTRGIDA